MKHVGLPVLGFWLLLSAGACGEQETPASETEDSIFIEENRDSVPNGYPFHNDHGFAASFHTAGRLDLTGNFFTPQGANGRHCGTCHAPEDGWSINPATVTLLFTLTDGTHPIFNIIDADRPDADLSTVEARWQSYSMLRQGKFIRNVTPPTTRDYDVIAAFDPFGFASTSRLTFFRRPLPTANFRSHTVMWDGANTVGTSLRDGLIRQARGNVTGAQQGSPATDAVIFSIVDYEMAVAHAQEQAPGAGNLDVAGADGGSEAASAQALVSGRFDLFDAWIGSNNPHRAQIARGQELFNNVNAPSGRRCGGCHNAANNGQNAGGTLFDIGTSRPDVANADMAIYTFRERSTGNTVQSTDPGQGIRNGQFASLNKFKTPNIRGLAARAPYFHNGIAEDLHDVVEHYELALGFVYTAAERDDLVAFLSAL